MSATVKGALKCASIAALAASLAACEPDELVSNTDKLGWLDEVGQMDWPIGEPYSADAVFASDALRPLSYASRMTVDPYDDYGDAPTFGYYDPGLEDYYDSSPPDGSYAWLALAAVLGDVWYDSPPDYYFDYDGVQPWVWHSYDNYVRYAEPIGFGYRYYYYEPGEAWPFLVRDPNYSYGYRDNHLVVIYDDDGRVLDGARSWRQRQIAERYFDRGGDLYLAAQDRPRRGVAASRWVANRATIAREQRVWDRAREQQVAWSDWQDGREQVIDRRWRGERAARKQAAQRFERWQKADFAGPAPQLYGSERTRIAGAATRQERRSALLDRRFGDQRFNRAEQRAEARLHNGGNDWRQAFAQRDRGNGLERQQWRGDRVEPGQARTRQSWFNRDQQSGQEARFARRQERQALTGRQDRSSRLDEMRQQRRNSPSATLMERSRSQRQERMDRQPFQRQAQREARSQQQRFQRQEQGAQNWQAQREMRVRQERPQRQMQMAQRWHGQREARTPQQFVQRETQAAQSRQGQREMRARQERPQRQMQAAQQLQAQREARSQEQRFQRQSQAAQNWQGQREARAQQQQFQRQPQAAQNWQGQREARSQQQRFQRQPDASQYQQVQRHAQVQQQSWRQQAAQQRQVQAGGQQWQGNQQRQAQSWRQGPTHVQVQPGGQGQVQSGAQRHAEFRQQAQQQQQVQQQQAMQGGGDGGGHGNNGRHGFRGG